MLSRREAEKIIRISCIVGVKRKLNGLKAVGIGITNREARYRRISAERARRPHGSVHRRGRRAWLSPQAVEAEHTSASRSPRGDSRDENAGPPTVISAVRSATDGRTREPRPRGV